MKAEEAKRLKCLEDENKRLKQIVADQALDIQMLKFLKCLSIVDEHTRECLALKMSRSITSEDVIDTLAELFAMRGVPKCIRSDNGPEFIAQAIRVWMGRTGVEALYIEPGAPWENGYAESFHSRLRDELLNREVFDNLRTARAFART